MNGKDLLVGLGYISSAYFEEAETAVLDAPPLSRRMLRRPLLVAAIIALTLLLVGCAVVYALRLQDMSIGQETYTQTFDENGKAIEPVEKTKDFLTMYGHNGDPIQLALTEWFAFLESYDPEGELMTNDPNLSDIPDQYEYIYSCYTADMVNKVDEIAGKYGLNLLEARIPFQQYQSDIFLKETGIHSLLLSDTEAEIKHMAGMLYLPYNFNMEFELVQENDRPSVWASYSYTRKDYLPRDFPGGGLDLSNYTQWDHTAANGTRLLLALGTKGHGLIIAEQENAMIIISIDGNLSNSAYPGEDEIISKAELEKIADSFDYSITPQLVDQAAVQMQLKETAATYEAEHAYVPETYGSFTDYLLRSYKIPNDSLQYTFYDLTGDGEEELLIGKNGAYDLWLTQRDGETQVRGVADTYLCEGGVQERYDEVWEIYETHIYIAPISDTVIDDIDAELNVITVLKREKDQWYQAQRDIVSDEDAITEETAKNVMAKYPRVELDWKPLMEYPLDASGTTLGDYLESKDVRLSEEALLQEYKQYLAEKENLYIAPDLYHTYCRILDINADGVDDLLLSGSGDFYWCALTYRYGGIQNIGVSDFYLCENAVLENVSTRINYGVEIVGHTYSRCFGFQEELLDFAAYNKASTSWQSDWYDTPMSESEADAILSKYPRIDQGMQPISELLN